MEDNKFRPIEDFELKELGINNSLPTKFHDENYLPPVVIGECIRGFSGTSNLRKSFYEENRIYAMRLRQYRNLYFLGDKDIRLLKPSQLKFKDVYQPYRGQDLTNKTVLIWGEGGFGDLLMLQPSIRYLKERYPNCKIILIFHNYHIVIKDWEYIDELLYDTPFPYEILINSDYQAIFANIIGMDVAKKTNQCNLFAKWMGLDIPDELLAPRLTPNQISLEKCRSVLKNWGLGEKSFIVIQIMSLSIIRTPSPNVWKKLIDALTSMGHKIIITDQPKNAKIIDDFMDCLERKENVFNFAHHSDTIADTIALTSLAKLAISTDSAMMHIAPALDIKALGIYGAFLGELRLSTYKNCDWIDCKAPCSPCNAHGYELCKNSISGYPACYENLDYNEAISKINKLLCRN